MRLIADSGLWVAGQQTEAPPLAAVLEVSGAVLSWTIDGPPEATQITLTDPSRADWLWRVLGAEGHVALASALDSAADPHAHRAHRCRHRPWLGWPRCAGSPWPLAAALVAGQPT